MDEEKEELIPNIQNNNSLVPQPAEDSSLQELDNFYDLTLNSILTGGDFYLDPENEYNFSEVEDLPQIATHPFLIQDRDLAFSLINELILSAIEFNKQILEPLQGPICPYQRTLWEYLGPNYRYPTIKELTIPITFSYPAVYKNISVFQNKVEEQTFEHLDIMVKEAAETSFVGITSQNLGNAFSVLSGHQYIIDRAKLSKHLEFGEIVRNLPQDYIDDYPYLTAYKLLAKYSDITQA